MRQHRDYVAERLFSVMAFCVMRCPVDASMRDFSLTRAAALQQSKASEGSTNLRHRNFRAGTRGSLGQPGGRCAGGVADRSAPDPGETRPGPLGPPGTRSGGRLFGSPSARQPECPCCSPSPAGPGLGPHRAGRRLFPVDHRHRPAKAVSEQRPHPASAMSSSPRCGGPRPCRALDEPRRALRPRPAEAAVTLTAFLTALHRPAPHEAPAGRGRSGPPADTRAHTPARVGRRGPGQSGQGR